VISSPHHFSIHIKQATVSTNHANVTAVVVPDTLEEWKLVFFGTETSVEVDDLDKDKPQPPVMQQKTQIQDNAATNARENAVDADSWTGSQQVERVSHPEVQRPATENQTSGCAAFEAGGGGCLGGCLILLLLAYLSGVPGCWQELITSWPASDSRSEPDRHRLLIATASIVPMTVTTVTMTTTASSTIGGATTSRRDVPATTGRASDACRCTWWQWTTYGSAIAPCVSLLWCFSRVLWAWSPRATEHRRRCAWSTLRSVKL